MVFVQEQKYDNKGKRYKSFKENKIWDTNAISPGTEFMNKLNLFLKKTYISKNILISDSDERRRRTKNLPLY